MNDAALEMAYTRTLATYSAAFCEEPPLPPWMPSVVEEDSLVLAMLPAAELAALRRDARKWRDAHPSDASSDEEDDDEDEDSEPVPVVPGNAARAYYAAARRCGCC